MALTFDTRKAFQKLLQRGLPEPAADGIVEVVEEATSTVVTGDVLRSELQAVRAGLRADMYRALCIQGAGMVAVAAVALTIASRVP